MYKQFVQCHLEFAVPAWSPWAVGDMDILEKVQKRAVSIVTGLEGKTYEEKLDELGLTTLRERRMKLDLVEVFKIINGYNRVDPAIWFNLVGQPVHIVTRNTMYSKNLVPSRARTEVRRNFFSVRVVLVWNNLPTEVKESRNINIFKTKLKEIRLTWN